MKQSSVWSDIVQHYRSDFRPLICGYALFLFFAICGALAVVGVAFFMRYLYGLAIPSWHVQTLIHLIHLSPELWIEQAALVVLYMPYIAWLEHGWIHFVVHMRRAGSAEFRLITATSLHHLWPVLVLQSVIFASMLACVVSLQHVVMGWQSILVCYISLFVLSRTLFASYYLVDNYMIINALQESNKWALKYPIFTTAAGVLLLARVLPLAYIEFLKQSFMLLYIVLVVVFLCLYILLDYAVACLYVSRTSGHTL